MTSFRPPPTLIQICQMLSANLHLMSRSMGLNPTSIVAGVPDTSVMRGLGVSVSGAAASKGGLVDKEESCVDLICGRSWPWAWS
jgi:hypothetical protein